jgi:hypothetical protein
MSTTTASPRTSSGRSRAGRPASPGCGRRPRSPTSTTQPDRTDHAEAAALDDRGIRVTVVKARWAARQRPGLPDAREWSATLAVAVIQTLLESRLHSSRTFISFRYAVSRCSRNQFLLLVILLSQRVSPVSSQPTKAIAVVTISAMLSTSLTVGDE